MENNTFHSYARMKERCNIKNIRSAERIVALAIERGKHAKEFTSWERRFLYDKKFSKNCEAIVYNNMCFIISETHKCITVFNLPAWFGKKKHFNGKEYIRKIKRYEKTCRVIN